MMMLQTVTKAMLELDDCSQACLLHEVGETLRGIKTLLDTGCSFPMSGNRKAFIGGLLLKLANPVIITTGDKGKMTATEFGFISMNISQTGSTLRLLNDGVYK